MSVPTWLALIAFVWSAAILGSASSQSFLQQGLLGWDSRDAAVTADRGPSLHATERRRTDENTGGKPLTLTAEVIATPAISPSRQHVSSFPRADISKRPHTLAQPRAPPENVAAHAS